MEMLAIVAILALGQFVFFSIQVGSYRGKYEIKAPAVSGAPEFERVFRVQQNTMEQLVVFLPTLWIFGHLVDPTYAAGFGLVYIVGRFVYRAEYLKDPASRSPGFMISFLPTAIMLVWSLIVALRGVF